MSKKKKALIISLCVVVALVITAVCVHLIRPDITYSIYSKITWYRLIAQGNGTDEDGDGIIDYVTNYDTLSNRRKSPISDEDRESVKAELLSFIQGKDAAEIDIINDDLKIADEDIVDGAVAKQFYLFNNSIYLQIDDLVMYRFQLNKNTKVTSYIKYELEA